MYKLSESTDAADAQITAQKSPPFGPGFPANLAAQATCLEVWGKVSGDQVEYRLYSGRVLLGRRRRAGFNRRTVR